MVVDREEVADDVRRGGVTKGKRTKRRRPVSPSEGGVMSCSSTAEDEGDAVTTSDDSTMISSTEEEEDMAHCLILLAQGGGGRGGEILPDASASASRTGFFVYECRTCNRVFPSFQALGGHRASHKKPKLPVQQPLMTMVEPAASALIIPDFDEEDRQFHKTTLLPAPLHVPGKSPGVNKQKVHECSICGSEFGSGQALGGHMRRHRPAPAGRSSDATKSQGSDEKLSRNVLPLDLNLPAPDDDRIDAKFAFGQTQQPRIIFQAGPALVDCHY